MADSDPPTDPAILTAVSITANSAVVQHSQSGVTLTDLERTCIKYNL